MSPRAITGPLVLAACTLALAACDKQTAEQKDAAQEGAALQAKYTVKAEEVDLEATVALLERSDVRDAEAVEALINAEDSPIQLDVDQDGERDFVQVHEVTLKAEADAEAEAEAEVEIEGETVEVEVDDGAKATFELRVVPSSQVEGQAPTQEVVVSDQTETPVVATVELEVDVEAEAVLVEAQYGPVVVIEADTSPVYKHEIHIHEHHDDRIVVAAPFVAWVWIGHRPVYVGHAHLPPGHAKKLGLRWHHGGHHPGHHGKTKVKIKHKGGPGPGGGSHHVKIKSKGGHGPGGHHVKVKHKGGPGGKGKGGKGKGKWK